MAVLHVAQIGHPVLRQVAEVVDPELIGSPGLDQFLDDLLETMEEYDGVGLAAPQVHVLLRIVALQLTDDRGVEFWINPVLTQLTDTTQRTVEGCLSIDGLRAAVDRPNHVRAEFLDRHGDRHVLELRGFPAVVAQHECDHLDGIVFVDRCDTSTLAFLKEYRRFGRLDEFFEREEADEDLLDDEVIILAGPDATPLGADPKRRALELAPN